MIAVLNPVQNNKGIKPNGNGKLLTYLNPPDKKLKLSKGVIHVVESMNDSFLALDTQGNIFYANNKAKQLFGINLKNLKDKNLNLIYKNNPRVINPNRFFRKINAGSPTKYEEYIDAAGKWVMVNSHFCQGGIFVYLTDITHYKLKEHYLKRSEERFKKMADTAPVLIWWADTEKKITYFNKSWLNFRGKSLEDEVGNGWIKGIHPEDADYCWDVYSAAFDARIEFQIEYRMLRFDNEYRWILSTGVPIHGPNGDFEGYIGSCIDITERKELEKRKDEFISIASHELKTPITSLKAFTQILSKLLKEEEQSQANQYLTRMHVQINKITMLIEELLDINKIEQKKLSFEKQEFDIKELSLEIVEDIKVVNPDFKIQIKGASRVKIFGDRDRIGQVLINLLNNAIKYSPNSKEIILTIEKKEGFVEVSVKDFGIGIAKNHLGLVFDRFFRAPGLKQETFPGLGLGLYISAEIIKRHGGKITVKSKEGKGSTFSFYIPLKGREKDV